MNETQDADNSISVNTESVVNSLPSNALTTDVIAQLQASERIHDCFPLYKRVDSDDNNVVCVLLNTEGNTGICVFNHETSQWEKVFGNELFDTAYSDEALETRDSLEQHLERLFELYDKSDIEFIHPEEFETFGVSIDVLDSLVTALPNEPVTRDVFHEFEKEPEIRSVGPHLVLEKNGTIVMFSITFFDTSIGTERFCVVFFNPDTDSWEHTSIIDASKLLNKNGDGTSVSECIDTGFDSVTNSYEKTKLMSLNTSEKINAWKHD